MTGKRAVAAVLAAASLALLTAPAAADETFHRLADKFTMIDARAGGVINQPLDGFWWWTDKGGPAAGPDANLFRHSFLGGNKWLLVHRGDSEPRIDEAIRPDARHLQGEGVPGVIGQLKYDGTCLNGLVRTVEVREANARPRCPQYYWWTRTRMCPAPHHRTAQMKTSGYKHDDETCISDLNRPHSFEKTMTRFLGAAFAPFLPGKYFHTVTVTAPAQFAAEVKLAWDYRALVQQGGAGVRGVRVHLGRYSTTPGGEVFNSPQVSGVRGYRVGGRGRYHFVFDAYDQAGKALHSDFLLADVN